MRRWEEEVSLLRREMVNFIMWYMDITIPRLMKIAKEMQAKIMVSSFIVKSTITFGMSRVFDFVIFFSKDLPSRSDDNETLAAVSVGASLESDV